MAFEKDYPNRKDWRKPYYPKNKRCDKSCRSHGGCPWCESNRMYKFLRQAKDETDVLCIGTNHFE